MIQIGDLVQLQVPDNAYLHQAFGIIVNIFPHQYGIRLISGRAFGQVYHVPDTAVMSMVYSI